MPLSYWFGWLVPGSTVSGTMLSVALPSAFARRVSTPNFPITLYVINGVMILALVARDGMWATLIAG